MTTKNTWSRIRDFSRYQINAEGVVRIKPNQTGVYYKGHGGEIMPLMAPDGPHPFYHLASDSMDCVCTVTQDALLNELAIDLAYWRGDTLY